MTSLFRNTHLFRILREYPESPLPLDVFLRKYFKVNRAIGSHDRRYIAESVYKMSRWQGLVDFFTQDASLEEKVDSLENLNPEEHLEDTTIPIHNRMSFPKEYFDFLSEQLGEEKAKELCFASNFPAPTTIRANLMKTDRETLFKRLEKTQGVRLGEISPTAIHFLKRVNFLILDEFKEGLFEVQDEASQIASSQVNVLPGEHFLDYCAGSGGKTLAIAPKMNGKGQVYLHDIRPRSLIEAKKRLKRAGIQNAQIVEPENLKKRNLEGKMDWVLVDAPCSGSGTLRRNPDMKWKFDKNALQDTLLLQREIFAKALKFVKKGGHIVYTTCSIFPIENEKQADYFVSSHAVQKTDTPSFQSYPSENGMDGFYSVVLQKC